MITFGNDTVEGAHLPMKAMLLIMLISMIIMIMLMIMKIMI